MSILLDSTWLVTQTAANPFRIYFDDQITTSKHVRILDSLPNELVFVDLSEFDTLITKLPNTTSNGIPVYLETTTTFKFAKAFHFEWFDSIAFNGIEDSTIYLDDGIQ